jgi:hypothetical protein
MRSHTGGGLTMGRGFPIVTSTKQKLNTRSSTESELVGVDDMMPIVVWSRYFLMAQGYGVTQNLLLQDNKSSMLLEKNGRASSGKRTRHINIRYYFITDRVNMKEIEIEWCPTKEMVADYKTKPLQGSHFRRLRDLIMGMTKVEKSKIPSKNAYDPIKNTYTVTKKDGRVKVRHLERIKSPGRDIVRRETTERASSPTSVALLAQ